MINVLRSHDLVGLDTPIFIYHLEGTHGYSDLVAPVFDDIEAGVFRGTTSIVTLMELAIRPIQLGRPDIADEYEARLVIFPNLSIREFSRQTMRQAATLRARYQLRAPDAMQLAACLHDGATAFLTNDIRLRRVTELDIIILNDFLDPV